MTTLLDMLQFNRDARTFFQHSPLSPDSFLAEGEGVTPDGAGIRIGTLYFPDQTEGIVQRCRIICRFIGTIPVAALLTTLSSGCAPFIADQQSAKLIAPGSLELTPSASYVSVSNDGQTEPVQTQFGLRLGYGLSSHVELRGMVEHVAIEDGGENTNILGAGAKIGLVPDRVSIYLPLGLLIGGGVETSESWTAVPTLLVNAVTTPTFELTPSFKLLVPLTGDEPDVFVGLHLGAGISNDLGRWALRPEIGMVRNPGEDGTVWGATLGVAFRP